MVRVQEPLRAATAAEREEPVAPPVPQAPRIAPTDGELLSVFCRRHEAPALERLIARHAEMVWRVCRQTLRSEQDAEDAFQATFLLLVRHAKAIKSSDSAAGWLFRVAQRTALAARKRAANRREEALAVDPESPSEVPFPDLESRQLTGVLLQELRRLPKSYQTALVLRYLEGRSRREIADQTDTTVSAVQGQLARGKRLLRRRLLRRGVSLSVAIGALAAGSSARGGPSTVLVATTTTNATSLATGGTLAASAAVLSLYRRGVRTMLAYAMAKPTAAAAVAATVLLAISGESPGAGASVATPQPLQLLAALPDEEQAATPSVAIDTSEASAAEDNSKSRRRESSELAPAETPPTDVGGSPSEERRFAPHDVVYTSRKAPVSGKPVYETTTVLSDGTISFPHHDLVVRVAGLTVDEAQAAIIAQLEKDPNHQRSDVSVGLELADFGIAPPTDVGGSRLTAPIDLGSSEPDQFVATRRPSGRIGYSDNKADGKKSLGGGGHLIKFTLPNGAVGVKSLRIHGSRYGARQAPREDFEITFLSEDRSEIIDVRRGAYGLFRRGAEKWTNVRMGDPVVDLPETFWVAIDFSPSQTKGVYLSYDTSTGGEHSMSGLAQQEPGEHRPVNFGGDWMVELVPQRVEAAAPKAPSTSSGLARSRIERELRERVLAMLDHIPGVKADVNAHGEPGGLWFQMEEARASIVVPMSHVRRVYESETSPGKLPQWDQGIEATRVTLKHQIEDIVQPLMPKLALGHDEYKQVRVTFVEDAFIDTPSEARAAEAIRPASQPEQLANTLRDVVNRMFDPNDSIQITAAEADRIGAALGIDTARPQVDGTTAPALIVFAITFREALAGGAPRGACLDAALKSAVEVDRKEVSGDIADKGASDGGVTSAAGWKLFFARKEAEAEKAFRHVLRKDPEDLAAVNGLAFSVLHQGRPAEAKPLFEKLLAKQPDAPGPLNGLARCLKAEGDLDGAIKVWERSIAGDRPEGMITDPEFSLAKAYSERKDWARARPLLERIVAQHPDSAEHAAWLAEASSADAPRPAPAPPAETPNVAPESVADLLPLLEAAKTADAAVVELLKSLVSERKAELTVAVAENDKATHDIGELRKTNEQVPGAASQAELRNLEAKAVVAEAGVEKAVLRVEQAKRILDVAMKSQAAREAKSKSDPSVDEIEKLIANAEQADEAHHQLLERVSKLYRGQRYYRVFADLSEQPTTWSELVEVAEPRPYLIALQKAANGKFEESAKLAAEARRLVETRVNDVGADGDASLIRLSELAERALPLPHAGLDTSDGDEQLAEQITWQFWREVDTHFFRRLSKLDSLAISDAERNNLRSGAHWSGGVDYKSIRKQFQELKGLEPTGELNEATWNALFFPDRVDEPTAEPADAEQAPALR